MKLIGMVAAACVAAAGTAQAQTEVQPVTADGRVLYPAAWFERFAPATAWDMASRVPGITVEDGEEVRGFAGAAGNVVINGERPSAKAETLESVLRRIPAAQVVRMEVVPGQAVGGEYRARPLVLNVVLAGGGTGLSGSAQGTLNRPYTGEVSPSIDLSLLRRSGDTALNLALRYVDNYNPDEGYDELRLVPGGQLVERRDKFNMYHYREGALSAEWSWTPAPDRAAHLNGRVWGWRNPLSHRSRVSDASGPLRNDSIEQAPSLDGIEVGGDLSRPMAGGVAKLVALSRREQYVAEEEALRRELDGDLLGGVYQLVDNTTVETVGRLTWSRDDVAGWSIETGAEAALNTLDSEVELAGIDAGGGRTPIPLPASNVTVEERRAEAFVSGGKALTPRLQFDWGAAVETSTLTVSGGAEAERTLTFLKPRASLSYQPDERWRYRLALDRLVSQLNFNDFVSSAEIANDRVNSANPDIEPERTWRLSALVERKLLGDGTVRLTVYYDQIEMVLDRIPTEVGFDAPGNLGDGWRLWSEAVVDVPLDRFLVPGGRFNLRWILQESEVTDPYTGRGRYFSGEVPWFVNWTFRQDVPGQDWAWGVNYVADGDNPNYRLNEIDTFNTENLNFGAFVEMRPSERVTVRMEAQNILDRKIVRDRDFFTPDRSSLTPYAHEIRERWAGTTFRIQVKRTFG